MKKMFFLLMVLSFSLTTVFAQNKEKDKTNDKNKGKDKDKEKGQYQNLSPEQKAEKITIVLSKKLLLTEDQKTKVKAQTLAKINKNKEIKEKYPQATDKAKRKAEFDAANTEYESQMKSILTEPQYQKWIFERNKVKDRIKKGNKDSKNKQKMTPKEEDADIEDIE